MLDTPEEFAALGLDVAAISFAGFILAGLYTAFFGKDDPGLARRVDFILALGSSYIFIFHQQLGLMMLAGVLTIALLREP